MLTGQSFSISFRIKFLEIYSLFQETSDGEAEIYESLKRDFPDNYSVQYIFAERHLKGISVESNEFDKAFESCQIDYSDLLESIASPVYI